MSKYRGHCAFNVFIALPTLIAIQFYLLHPKSSLLLIFIASFTYTTFFMSPDLDLVHKIKIFSLRGFFALPFRAYSHIFRHRGISHSFLFGSLTRIGWLSGVFLLIFYLIYRTLPSRTSFVNFWIHYKPVLIYGFSGIACADWSHLLLDFRMK